MFRSAQHDREFGLAGVPTLSIRKRVQWVHSSLKLENDFAAALTFCRVCDCGFRVAERISFLDLSFQQTAFRHFEQRLEGFHTLLLCRVIVPFVYPDAAETQIFENEKAVRNFQWLQTHCAKCDQR